MALPRSAKAATCLTASFARAAAIICAGECFRVHGGNSVCPALIGAQRRDCGRLLECMRPASRRVRSSSRSSTASAATARARRSGRPLRSGDAGRRPDERCGRGDAPDQRRVQPDQRHRSRRPAPERQRLLPVLHVSGRVGFMSVVGRLLAQLRRRSRRSRWTNGIGFGILQVKEKFGMARTSRSTPFRPRRATPRMPGLSRQWPSTPRRCARTCNRSRTDRRGVPAAVVSASASSQVSPLDRRRQDRRSGAIEGRLLPLQAYRGRNSACPASPTTRTPRLSRRRRIGLRSLQTIA